MYILSKTIVSDKNKSRVSYGVILKEPPQIRYDDLSEDKNSVTEFIDRLNKENAEPCHLPFLVEEFLSGDF